MGRLPDHALSRAPQGQPAATAAWCSFDPALCTGCAICRFRCTARAIAFNSAARANSPGATIPASAPFAGAAWRAARPMRSARNAAMPACLLDHWRVEEVLHRRPQAARSSQPRRQRRLRSHSRSRIPVPEARNDRRTDSARYVREKLGIATHGRKGRRSLARPGALTVRELARR